MASSRPSSAPLYQPDLYPSLGPGEDTLIPSERGANQFLRGNSHAGTPTTTSRSNRVQAGQLPRTSGPAIGSPDPINPSGRGSDTSLNG